jgi:Fe2+ or Zn2+ uptake regulation protein
MQGIRAQQGAARLREAGLRVTPQRIGIVDALDGDRSHPTAQALFDRLRPTFPGMAFGTVYNTLAALTRAGSVRPVRLPGVGSAMRFDPNVLPHDHAICDRCGALQDVQPPSPADDAHLGDFKVQRVDRIYRGICSDCQGT